jgi:hypothetical protein
MLRLANVVFILWNCGTLLCASKETEVRRKPFTKLAGIINRVSLGASVSVKDWGPKIPPVLLGDFVSLRFGY